ncbi:MAG: hypothetical protein WA949_12065 [Phormidesmis sp.]
MALIPLLTVLSEGKDSANCGRPCEKHEAKLRDRTGAEHSLSAIDNRLVVPL